LSLKLRYSLCDRLVYSKVREAFGGSIRFCISGGAPLSPKIAEFFDTAGIQIVEGYGLTETCPVVSVNRLDKNKFGTVGLPLPNAKFRIAEDGEILIKAPNVAHKGYLGKADETEAMFTEDGWLKTGDIGYIDEEGFIVITGRKKEIIVNSFGENIAPAPIESALSEDLLISSCAVFGDGKPFLVALISPNKEELSKFTRQHGLENLSFDEICKHPTLEERIKRTVDSVNSKLSSAEAIRRFRIVEDEWSAESGEITPTLKVRREIIFKKYKDIINSMYEEKRI
jgi:long-chain acyl-CoA synthetase